MCGGEWVKGEERDGTDALTARPVTVSFCIFLIPFLKAFSSFMPVTLGLSYHGYTYTTRWSLASQRPGD